MPLETTLAEAEGEAIVIEVGVPTGQRRRLAELGLREGARLAVLQRTSGGSLVVAVGASRLAVDRRSAQLVNVRQA